MYCFLLFIVFTVFYNEIDSNNENIAIITCIDFFCLVFTVFYNEIIIEM